jgi:SPP1 gp7 family putative phage head morphogenesis protein
MTAAKKTDSDPTGQRRNRRRTEKKFNALLDMSRQYVIYEFAKIQKSRTTVKKMRNEDLQAVYGYQMTPEQTEIFNNQIRYVLNQSLLETQGSDVPIRWWYKSEVEEPYRQGSLETFNEFNLLIAIAIGLGMTGTAGMAPQKIPPEVVLSSQRYLEKLRSVYAENFNVIKSLSDRTASQVIRVINNGIQSGLTPTEIRKEITERFDVAKSSAARIAKTEINKAYNDAKIRAINTAAEMSGLNAAVRHISALLPNRTRKTHAARHMKVYTTQEQLAWWNSGTNRINCFCSVVPVLLDDKGDIVGRKNG